MTGKSHDQALEELMPQAEENLKSSLALARIVQDEGITVSGEDIDAEIETLLEDYPVEQRPVIRPQLEGKLRSVVANSVLDHKLRDLIVAIATGTAPEASAAE